MLVVPNATAIIAYNIQRKFLHTKDQLIAINWFQLVSKENLHYHILQRSFIACLFT